MSSRERRKADAADILQLLGLPIEVRPTCYKSEHHVFSASIKRKLNQKDRRTEGQKKGSNSTKRRIIVESQSSNHGLA